jgi:phage FluMu protein Com
MIMQGEHPLIELRCKNCNKLLARVEAGKPVDITIKCKRCKGMNTFKARGKASDVNKC